MKATTWLLGLLTVAVLGSPGGADAQKMLRQRGSFPLVISKSGSYKLRSNLTVPDANTTAIQIVDPASDVTIDLNGFTISGPTVCTGTPPSLVCTPTGAGVGILRDEEPSSASAIVVVTNGTIRGMGADGITVYARQVRIERVQAYSNGGSGITVDAYATFSNNLVSGNGEYGILAGYGVVRDNIAEGNGFGGNYRG